MEWNPQLYQDRHAFVTQYGKDLLEYVRQLSPAAILDLGCGTGTLTDALRGYAGRVVGIDASAHMIAYARKQYPGIEFCVMDALALPYREEFDAVFSNAVFHWIPRQEQLLRGIHTALKPGGKLICEFGAYGNIRAIQQAFCAALGKLGYSYYSPFFFAIAQEYGALLGDTGFLVETVFEFDRPTPLAGAQDGLRHWMTQFFAHELGMLTDDEREGVLKDVEKALAARLWDGSQWIADYRRLRAVARKPTR
ncbi:MAG: class I SAM-dependent methyltransferase [Eubacteriales bacterium]|nr:class I SAM-dependent methyltransferase [Eubacteriales bacterium]